MQVSNKIVQALATIQQRYCIIHQIKYFNNIKTLLFFRYFEAENSKVFCILEGRKVVFNRILDLFRDSTRQSLDFCEGTIFCWCFRVSNSGYLYRRWSYSFFGYPSMFQMGSRFLPCAEHGIKGIACWQLVVCHPTVIRIHKRTDFTSCVIIPGLPPDWRLCTP